MFQQSATQDEIQSASLRAAGSATLDRPALQQPPLSQDLASQDRDAFLDHYFKRIDPKVAESFSAEQCEAIKTMFGARGIAQHSVEVRRSLPVGRGRYYLVLLIGRERRTFGRLYRDGDIGGSSNLVGYAVTAALWAVPAVAAALLLNILL